MMENKKIKKGGIKNYGENKNRGHRCFGCPQLGENALFVGY